MGATTEARHASCPIWSLHDWVLGHYDVVTLCRGFDCPVCVADPGDLGPTEPPAPLADDGDREVPL